MKKNETTHVRISLKDQLDILSKYYGVTRATILNALVEEKFQSLREENNGNSRIYPKAVLESAMDEMSDKIRNKECYGECGHSQQGNVDYWRVSHLFESIRKRGNDWWGHAKILDTPGGNILKAIVKESGACGFSTKGMGSVKKLPNGLHEVQSDYRCTSIDCVPSPSNPASYVKAISEGVENK